MKKIVTIAVLAFTIYTCTDDEGVMNQNLNQAGNASLKKSTAGSPANPLNPKDSIGALYGLLYENYEPGTVGAVFTDGLAADVLSFALQEEGFAALAAGESLSVNVVIVQGLYTSASQNFEGALTQTSLSAAGRASLAGLAATFGVLKEAGAGFDPVHEALTSYEQGIGTDASLLDADTALLFTTASLLRYELDVQRRKKRKDRDWEMSVGHIAAAAYGASKSEPEAILYGLITAYP